MLFVYCCLFRTGFFVSVFISVFCRFQQVERVVDSRFSDENYDQQYLVKWNGLPYVIRSLTVNNNLFLKNKTNIFILRNIKILLLLDMTKWHGRNRQTFPMHNDKSIYSLKYLTQRAQENSSVFVFEISNFVFSASTITIVDATLQSNRIFFVIFFNALFF